MPLTPPKEYCRCSDPTAPGHNERLCYRNESGAVAVMVALLMVVFMAMLAFAVDVGAMHLRRREMVNGADASALAVAIRYTATGNRAQESLALDQFKKNLDANAVANGNIVADALVWGDFDNQQQPHSVTVAYHTDQEMYFSPVLGFPQTHEVYSTATAYWGNGQIGSGSATWTCGNPADSASPPCTAQTGNNGHGNVPICHSSSFYNVLNPDVKSDGTVGHENDVNDIIPFYWFQAQEKDHQGVPAPVLVGGVNWPTITHVVSGYEYLLNTPAADFLNNGCGAPGLHIWLGK